MPHLYKKHTPNRNAYQRRDFKNPCYNGFDLCGNNDGWITLEPMEFPHFVFSYTFWLLVRVHQTVKENLRGSVFKIYIVWRGLHNIANHDAAGFKSYLVAI